MTKPKHEIAVDLFFGVIAIGILVGLLTSEMQEILKQWANKVMPGMPYSVLLILSLFIIALIYILAKKLIKKNRELEDFTLEKQENITPAVKHLLLGLKTGSMDDNSLLDALATLGSKEFKKYAGLIRIRIGKRRSNKMARLFYKTGYDLRHERGKIQEAREYYEIAAELRPGRSVYLNEAAEIYFHQGDYEEAKTFFLAALFHYKKNKLGIYNTQNNLAMCFLKLKKYNESLEFFNKAADTLRKKTRRVTIEKVKNIANIGALFKDMKRYDDSRRYLLDAERLLPSVRVCNQHDRNEYAALKGMIPRTLSELYLDLFNSAKDKEVLNDALKYGLKALEYDQRAFGDSGYTPLDYCVLGKIYDELALRDQAIFCYKNSYIVLSEIDIEVHESRDYCKNRLIEMGEM